MCNNPFAHTKPIMKKSLSTYLMLAAATTLTPLQATVLWYADPNNTLTQDFYRFDTTGYTAGQGGGDCTDDPANMPTAFTFVDPALNRKIWTIHKPLNRKRAEFARTAGTIQNYVPASGDDIYIGYRWKLNSAPALATGLAVFQWKSDGANLQNYPLIGSYNGTKLSFAMVGPGYNGGVGTGSIASYTTQIWSGNVALNTWVSLVIHIKVSPNPAVGKVEFWFNGVKQTLTNTNPGGGGVTLSADSKTAFGKTWDTNGNYMKWGAYNAGACQYITQTFYEKMRVATTFAEANPASY
jgi:hypothetical protein